ncbi:hypothetical protein HYV86_07355 [Candidatus Woesearchaeota archaeon]|nr:hypothetical protein [Candidatus Woesearchaeota archaeon]
MRTIILILSIVALLLVAGCAQEAVQPEQKAAVAQEEFVPAPQVTGQVYQVVMESGEFMPLDLVINVGDTVEWVNVDYRERPEAADDYRGNRDLRNDENPEVSVRYTVTFETGEVDADLVAGATVQYTFMQPGQYFYFNKYEPAMRGSVIVE